QSVRNYPYAVTTHNLTVNLLHTYYVLAGVTPVLVHNCDTATVHELSMTKPAHGTEESHLAPLQRLSDEEFLQAVNRPHDGHFITINEHSTVVQGNHRVAELIRRAESPDHKIDWTTKVAVRRHQRDLSMFDDFDGGGPQGGVKDLLDLF
ncbi:hypothetical protein, partial [Kitasatospora sp. MY 5-36]|uniref:hypothetical protein n=1 Tax=Kitasatospora sp. MY 5-36 TaxID=1678027 RepID=UPI00067078EC